MQEEQELKVVLPKSVMYLFLILLLIVSIFGFIVIPINVKEYINIFPIDINDHSYKVSRLYDLVCWIQVCIDIYGILTYYRKKIIVKGNIIEVYPLIGKMYSFKFKDIKSVKRKISGHGEELFIITKDNRKISTENIFCGYSEFYKLIIDNTEASIRE